MIQADIEKIESCLGVKLPAEYCDFVINYPDDLDEDIRAHDIYADADAVILATETLRNGDNSCLKWPQHYVIIGDSGSGDYYYLHTKDKLPAIYWWNQTAEELEQVAQSIDDWYQDIIGNM